MESNCPKCGAKPNDPPAITKDYRAYYWDCYSKQINDEFKQSMECQLAAANSEVERLRKENAELQARYATLANEASNASLHNAFE